MDIKIDNRVIDAYTPYEVENLTLHEAMQIVLSEVENSTMHASKLADEIYNRNTEIILS